MIYLKYSACIPAQPRGQRDQASQSSDEKVVRLSSLRPVFDVPTYHAEVTGEARKAYTFFPSSQVIADLDGPVALLEVPNRIGILSPATIAVDGCCYSFCSPSMP